MAIKQEKKSDNKPQAYEVLTLEPRSTLLYTDFSATVMGKEVVDIRPMADGYLKKTYVPEGANVTKGELLFHLTNPIYDQAVITENVDFLLFIIL